MPEPPTAMGCGPEVDSCWDLAVKRAFVGRQKSSRWSCRDMSCAVSISMQPLDVQPSDLMELPNGYSLAKRKRRLATEILSTLATTVKTEYNKKWSKAGYDASPFEYTRKRLVRQLNNKSILAPRHDTIMNYSLQWDPVTDTWR